MIVQNLSFNELDTLTKEEKKMLREIQGLSRMELDEYLGNKENENEPIRN